MFQPQPFYSPFGGPFRFPLLPLILCIALLGGRGNLTVRAQAPLFASDSLLTLRLEADWSAVQSDRAEAPDYHHATLSYRGPDGEPVAVKAELKVRGRFRRDPIICEFPPLRLKFGKKVQVPEPFEGQRKLKIVTHCHDDEYILREYYLYKMYQLLSPYYFDVRLAQIEYVDVGGEEPTETHFAFFIEDDEDMASRMGSTLLDEEIALGPESVDPDNLLLLHLFQYMIANQDFLIEVRQNVKVTTHPGMVGLPIVVPYDFDWSGLVDAPYTKLAHRGKESSYEQRQNYKKLCRSTAEYEEAISYLENQKSAIFDLYESSPYLSRESVNYTLRNLKSFYKQIARSKSMEEIFLAGCE